MHAPLEGLGPLRQVFPPGCLRLLVVPLLFLCVEFAPAVARGSEGPSGARESEARLEPTRLQAIALQHRKAELAVALVYDLLSPRGTVQIQPTANTLVIRDIEASLERVVEVLRDFDRPVPPVMLQLTVVRAGSGATGPNSSHLALPAVLLHRLGELFRYDGYSVLAATQFEIVQGEDVTYQIGDEFRLEFRLDRLLDDGRLKLGDFRIASTTSAPIELDPLQADLNLRLDRPTILGLTRSESSREALMLVLVASLTGENVKETAQSATIRADPR